MKTKRIGDAGEDIAAAYLERKGYGIVRRNYRIRGGEVDIIADDGGCLVFVEVKTRKNRNFAAPCEFVDSGKRQRIIRCAVSYLQEMDISPDVRFDVIEVLYEGCEINHIKNAFWEM